MPWKEINNYYPFSVGAVPNTATYRQALRLYDDPAQYPVFPFYTANQVDKKAAADAGEPGSNNFSTINSTVQFRLYSSVLRNYPNSWMTATDYKKLLYWNTWRSTSAATPPGRTPTSSGPTGTAARSPTAPGSTTTSSAAATGR